MHFLRSDEACRNTMFNGQAQSAARYVDGTRRCGLNRFRLELLEENAEKTAELIGHYRALLQGRTTPEQLMQRLNVIDRIGVTDMK
jgi:putative protease